MDSVFCEFFQKRVSLQLKNKIMDEIRGTIPPALKMQMELSVAIANRIYDILEEKDMSQKEFARLILL